MYLFSLKSLRKRKVGGITVEPAADADTGLTERIRGLEMDLELIRSELHSLRTDSGNEPPGHGKA